MAAINRSSPRRPRRRLFHVSRSFAGWMPGRRFLGGRIPTRSRLELHALTILNFDHAIREIERNDLSPREQLELGITPTCPTYFVVTPLGRYTPDLRVTLEDGEVIYASVGTLAAKTQPPEPDRLLAVREQMRKDGYRFLMLTEREVRENKRAQNLGRLLAANP